MSETLFQPRVNTVWWDGSDWWKVTGIGTRTGYRCVKFFGLREVVRNVPFRDFPPEGWKREKDYDPWEDEE